MKTINQLHVKTTYFIGFVLLASLVGYGAGVSPASALSCVNPTEMIDYYVSDDRFSIALVTAGELETEGAEHTQIVTVKENLKGATDTSVSFTYHETWQYLCAGQPAVVGTEAVYVTSEGAVTQVIPLDSTLYDLLMNALDDTPDEPTPTPTPEEETKRTLMQRIIGLLQQIVSLLTSEPTPPLVEVPVASTEALIGMTTSEAEAYTASNDMLFRVVEIDGEPQPTTKDYRPGRINAAIENNVVVSYTVEGEEPVEETAESHNEIIGMTQAEAEAYATAKNVPFRIGRIDDEYLPVTMDFRPGRITAEIENGVIVDYSVE